MQGLTAKNTITAYTDLLDNDFLAWNLYRYEPDSYKTARSLAALLEYYPFIISDVYAVLHPPAPAQF